MIAGWGQVPWGFVWGDIADVTPYKHPYSRLVAHLSLLMLAVFCGV